MKKENFGKLLRALRDERNEDGLLDQKGLAEELSKFPGLEMVTSTVVSSLERGRRLPTSDELVALAKIFQMSSAERREFILAANNVGTKYLVSEMSDPEKVFEHCKDVVSSMQAPSILIDNYYDLIGVNKGAVALFGLTEEAYGSWKDAPYPHNILQVMLTDSLREGVISYRGRYMAEFELRNVLNYRTRTLLYRHHDYFKEQLQRFKKTLPRFRSLWREAQTTPEMEDSFYGRNIIINHRKYKRLLVRGSTALFPTARGNLEIIVETPADEYTRDIMPLLMKDAGQGYVDLYRWPDERKLASDD